MLPDRQQVFGTRSARNRTDRAAILAGIATLLIGLWACQGTPPRADKWRDEAITDLAPIEGQASSSQAGSTPAGGAPGQVSGDIVGRALGGDRKQTLRIHMNADPGSLNPMASPSAWTLRIMLDSVFETLLRYQPGPTGPGVYEAGLARSWTVSPGGREIRLRLQPSATFHDGKSVTAVDVQFSIEAAMTKRGGADHHRGALSDVAAVEILARDHIRLRLHRSNAFVLRELASVPIFPEHVYRKLIRQRSGSWVGSGPYQVSRNDQGDVFLSRHDKYWGDAPAIRWIQFVRHKDSALALREAKEGQMDILPELIAEHYPEQAESPGIASKFSRLELRPASYSYMVFNTKSSPFDDPHLRRAMVHLIDSDALVALSGGLRRRVAGPIWPGGPGDGASPAVPSQNQAELSRLMQLAGWRDDDGDGVRARSGQRLMITVLATEGEHPERDLVLRALRKAGFVLDVRVGSAAVLRNRLRDAEFNLAFVGRTGDVDQDLSPLFASEGKQNFGRMQSATIDGLLTRIKNAWQPAHRAPLLTKLAEALRRSVPIVAISAPDPHGLVHKRVRGLELWNGWFRLRDLSLAGERGE